MRSSLQLAFLAALGSSLACAHLGPVQADELHPRYARPVLAALPDTSVAIIYDPRELPDDVRLTVPSGFPTSTVHHARALVTKHLREALEAVFERVVVVEDPSLAPAGATLATVHFVEVGVTVSSNMVVGTLEWSVSLRRAGDSQAIYSWAERTVGTRGGYGRGGYLDAGPLVQGALEASFRALLKDMQAHDLAHQLAAPVSRG
ncbi:MAG TPA: hypothetical protein VFE90_25125 [Myxococcales bacterium]|jgi:hypothetical protein|nr:hypothetical protein [Myxococcales bacterium]